MKSPSPSQETVFPLDVYGDIQRITRVFYSFILLIIIGLVAGVVIVLSRRDAIAAALIGIFLLPVLASLYFVRRKKFEFTAAFLAIVLISLLTITATRGLGIHQISVLGYPAILIVASLVTSKRTMVFLVIYNIACVAWLVFGEIYGAYIPKVLVRSVAGDFFSVTIILIITAIMVRVLTGSLFQSNFQLQKELRERKLAEDKYRNIVENAIDGIFRSTTEGRFISVNSAMARMYGYQSPEEMIENVTDISSQLYVEPVLRSALRDRLADGGQIMGFESQDYRKDGSIFWTSTNVRAIRDETGEILYYEGTVEDITNRKMADEVLRESEERYRTLFNGILDGIYRSSHDGRFVDVNPAMIKMFGYASKEEMLAVDIKKEMYFAPEERESLFLDTGQEKVDIFRMRRKDGAEIWVEDHGRYVHDEKGNVIFHEGILRDITPRMKIIAEREQAEQALRESERQLMDSQVIAGLGSYSLDITTGEWKSSDVLDKLFGIDKTYEHSIEGWAALIHPDDRQMMTDYFSNEVVGKRLRFDKEYRIIRNNDQAERWVHGIGELAVNAQGQLVRMLGTIQDITEGKMIATERERLIKELEIKNAESETLRESLASIVGTFEFTEIIQRILDQIRRVVPYDSASVWRIEGNLRKFVAGRNLPPRFENADVTYPLDDANSASRALRGEVPYVLNNNVQEELPDFRELPDDMINSWLAIPLKTRGKVIGLIALDGKMKDQFNEHHAELSVIFADQVAVALENARLFSDLQSELADRKKLISELESKNAELERFTYTVSHDLKAPLVTINGFLGYLETDAVSGKIDQVKRDSQRIQEAVNKMYTLLNELLELSRVGRMKNASETIRFEDLVNGALDIVHGRLEERGVTVQVQPNLPAIYGDRQRLTEVLQNLIDNAAKFMGDQADPRIEIGQRRAEDGKQIFFVKDNGIGINPEYHERVFGLFNKLEAQGEGTGVGLALVKRIIEVHGGTVWVESETGRGSTFCFTVAGRDEDHSPRTS